ncbi:MAG TPA: methyltransferase domain-containing protein [Planctomycetota bacterium]|nr:methyltransferase domain-containing protein [Planctomycetota bacterium]
MSHEILGRTFDQWACDGRDAGMELEHGNVAAQVIAQLDIRPGEQILELGCGNGWATRMLAKSAAGATAVGVDVSPKMIERAEALHSLTIRARYEIATFESLGFKDSKFDRLFSMEALYYAVDLERALSEGLRVLKPGGRADVVVDFYQESPSTAVWPSKVGLAMHYLSIAQWQAAFERSGFVDVQTRRVHESQSARPVDASHAESKAAGSLWLSARKPG